MRQIQRGFTLIELVVVIVILGILAATALPKFVDLGKDARIAVIKAAEGSMRAANSMIYAKAASGNQMGATGSVSINGTTVGTIYGFADALGNSSNAGLLTAMDYSASDFDVVGQAIQHKGATTPANCSVTYAPAASASTPPTYTLNTSGC